MVSRARHGTHPTWPSDCIWIPIQVACVGIDAAQNVMLLIIVVLHQVYSKVEAFADEQREIGSIVAGGGANPAAHIAKYSRARKVMLTEQQAGEEVGILIR